MFRKTFTKEELYATTSNGRWQDKWAETARLYITLKDWGCSIIRFNSESSPDVVYVRDGDTFTLIGQSSEDGYKVYYNPSVWGFGRFVGYVTLPTRMLVLEDPKGFTGTIWKKRKKGHSRLEKEGLLPPQFFTSGDEWVGSKTRFVVRLKGYSRFPVYGKQWEETFVKWEEKKKQVQMDFFFRFGLQFVDRFPPRRHLAPSEYREYVAMLGEHMWWKNIQEQERWEEELIKNIWGKYENILGEYEEEGFHLITDDSDYSISGPLDVLAFLRFLASMDPDLVLERRPSPYIISNLFL